MLLRPLPEIPVIPLEAPLTPRGRDALEIWLLAHAGLTEEEIADFYGLSRAQVRRRLSYAQTHIWNRLLQGERRRCKVCGDPLPIDARRDAHYCQNKSTCRSKMQRRGIRLRRSYGGRWSRAPIRGRA